MFYCETCGTDDPDKCTCVNVGMSPINGELASLDRLTAEVRECCRAEAQAADEANLLRRLADEAKARHHERWRERQTAESRARAAYNEAVTP